MSVGRLEELSTLGNPPPEVELAGSTCEDRASPGSVGIPSADASTQGTSARVIGGAPSAGKGGERFHSPPAAWSAGLRHLPPATEISKETRAGMKLRQLCNEAFILRRTSAGPFGPRSIPLPAYRLIS